MSVKTGRAEGKARVSIDYQRCTGCGLCVQVCKGAPLYLEEGRVKIDQSRWFGCIGCGQCMAVCPRRCISVEGRCLSPSDVLEMPPRIKRATYDQLYSLMLSRRSIRDFKEQEVEQEAIDLILQAASTSPMGLPPSDVGVVIFKGRQKVQEFAADVVKLLESYQWLLSPVAIALLRPFMKKETYESYTTFVIPAARIFIEGRRQGNDYLLYNAPLAMYFHGSLYSDPVDPYIPATYAMLAAEAMDLGACMIGSVAPFLMNNKPLCRKYGIPPRSPAGIVVIFGYPRHRYSQALRRSFAQVHYY